MLTLDLAQALMVADRVPAEELPDLACELLSHGFDTPAVRELAGLQNPTLREARPVFERVLRELKRPAMGRLEAATVVARGLADQVITGHIAPLEAAARGALLCPDFDYPDVLTYFLACHDDYECFPRDRATIDEDVRRRCKELLTGERKDAV
jgi:hypothetical protein